MVLASRAFSSSKLFSVSGVDGTSLCVSRAQPLAAKSQADLDLAGERQHVRIKPRAEQHVGLNVLRLAVRLGLGERPERLPRICRKAGTVAS